MRDQLTSHMTEAYVRARTTAVGAARRTRERLADEEGQTAAEYIGIILVIAAIIAVIGATGIAGTITTEIKEGIKGITGPKSGGGQPAAE